MEQMKELEELIELLNTKQYTKLRQYLAELNEADIASLMEEMEEEDMLKVFRILPKDLAADVFSYLDVDNQQLIITSLSDREAANIINNLMAYQFIAAFMNNGAGRKNARRFAPMITRNEYFAQQISTTEHYKASDIPEIVAALFKYTKGADKDELLAKIESAVRRNSK